MLRFSLPRLRAHQNAVLIQQIAKHIVLLIMLLVSWFSSYVYAESASNANNASVAICDDENLWPPYAFLKNGQLTGAMVETTNAIFQHLELPHTIHLSPWKRCLYQVEHFKGEPAFEVFINGSFSKERATKYLVSQPVYTTGNAYFYSEEMFDAAPHIKSLSDLNDFSVCGVHGYNYDMYKIKRSQMSVVANDLHSAFRLLKSGRCEIILNAYSVPFGSLYTDNPMIDENIKAKVFEELPTQSFHIFVSKKTPRAAFLLQQINSALTTLKENGELDRIFRNYLPDCGMNC